MKAALSDLRSTIAGSRAARDAGIVGIVQIISMGIRLAGNIVLAALLSPAIFGLLGIVTAIRTGIELLTDVGITQSIIVSDDGAKKEFIETAWALQIVRGIVLAFLAVVTAFPIAWYYGQPELGLLLLVASLSSIAGGLARPGPALNLRERRMSRIAAYRLAVALFGFVSSVAFAWLWENAMALIIAGVAASFFASFAAFLVHPLPGYRPKIHKSCQHQIVNFGKWIFFSSVIYFVASNFDRLYLPTQIPLFLFGIYNISRSLTDAVTQMGAQVNRVVVLPAVSRSKGALRDKRSRLATIRFVGLGVISAAIGVLIASADLLVTVIFDERYQMASVIFPVLLFGCWFTIHASVVETTLMGMGFPAAMVSGNLLRLISTVIGLPLAIAMSSFALALVIVSLADLPRYFWLTWHAVRKGVSFGKQDPALFLIMILTAFACREFILFVGLADGFVSSIQAKAFLDVG